MDLDTTSEQINLYSVILFGSFVAFLIIFFMGICSKKIETYWFLLGPLIGALLSYVAQNYVAFFLHYLLICLDFPFSFVEVCLYTQLVNFISRYILKENPKRGTPYRIKIACICIPILVLAFFIVLDDFHLHSFNFLHGVALGATFFTFIYSIVADNGILTDAAMITLKTALVLAPSLSNDGAITSFLRLFLTLLSIISFNFKYEEKKWEPKVLQAVFKKIAKRQTQVSLMAMMLTYTFLSPNAFIHPKPPLSDYQAVLAPLVFMFYLLNEAMYYHIHVTPIKTQ